MEDQQSHHFSGLGGYGVLLCGPSPGVVWQLPCAVPWGGGALQATSTSMWSCASRCDGLCQICFLPVFWLVWSWTQPCTQCPVPNPLPVQSRVAALQNPLTSVKSSDGGPMPWCCRPEVLPQRCQNATSPTVVVAIVWPLLPGIWCRFSSPAFSWVASDIHGGVWEQNNVHKVAGSQGRDFFW